MEREIVIKVNTEEVDIAIYKMRLLIKLTEKANKLRKKVVK